jgi:hypothetical protein
MIKKQMRGKTNIWQNSPIITAFGKVYTRLKSASVSESPRPVIMSARARGIRTTDKKLACIHFNFDVNK